MSLGPGAHGSVGQRLQGSVGSQVGPSGLEAGVGGGEGVGGGAVRERRTHLSS